ncbi:hypothetical protein Tco_0953858 [Tanacetum coccineum]|uniref:Uncharacterized protein n=1 Tax=Tanacetum coccineum TaxID=301880 RepID=A0ABQ5E1F8_9ASTR
MLQNLLTKELIYLGFRKSLERYMDGTAKLLLSNLFDFCVQFIISHIAGKHVTISEASIRSDLLFDGADEIDSLNNQAIFNNIQLICSKSTSWDQIPTNIATAIQPNPSPRPSPTTHIVDSIPEGSSGDHGGHSSNDASLLGNKDGQEAKERSQTTYHTSQSLDEDKIGKEDFFEEKGDPAFDDLDDFMDVDDTLDYMETEDVQEERRNEGTEKGNEGTDKGNKGTDKQDGGTDNTKVSTDRQGEGTTDQDEGKSVTQTPTSTPTPTTPTPTVFGNDETIAQVLIIMSQNKEKLKEKEKGVEIRNVEETKRPRPTSKRSILTLRPIPKIDPKDKGKKRIEKEERERCIPLNKEQNFFMTPLLHKGNFLLNKGKKHSDLKTKSFDEIQVLYEKIKRSDDSFIAISSAEDEKVIKESNEQAVDASKKRVKKDDSVKEEIKAEKGTKKRKSGHVKMIARKRPRPQPDDDSDDEHKKCLRMVTFEGTIDSEIMETKSFIVRLHKVSSPDGNYLVVCRVNGHFRAFNYLMKIMMESSTEENDQVELKDGTVIYMLVERRYPLSKELLQRMLDLGLEVEEKSTAALQLVRFIKQQLNEE